MSFFDSLPVCLPSSFCLKSFLIEIDLEFASVESHKVGKPVSGYLYRFTDLADFLGLPSPYKFLKSHVPSDGYLLSHGLAGKQAYYLNDKGVIYTIFRCRTPVSAKLAENLVRYLLMGTY